MKKIVILGCENSHADQFLNFITKMPEYSDVEVVGIYSDELPAAERLANIFGVKVMENYDSDVGELDGVIITARHGDNHLKYALPYIKKGIPMFIDKPITIDEEEAITLGNLLKENSVRVSGGSSLAKEEFVCSLAEDAKLERGGRTLGGIIRAPMDNDERYGGLFFYAQHLCEMVMKIFGRYPNSVWAVECKDQINVTFRYDDYDINGLFVKKNYHYFACRFSETESCAKTLNLRESNCFKNEFKNFYDLLEGGEMDMSYTDFIAPVFVMNALVRSLESGDVEEVRRYRVDE